MDIHKILYNNLESIFHIEFNNGDVIDKLDYVIKLKNRINEARNHLVEVKRLIPSYQFKNDKYYKDAFNYIYLLEEELRNYKTDFIDKRLKYIKRIKLKDDNYHQFNWEFNLYNGNIHSHNGPAIFKISEFGKVNWYYLNGIEYYDNDKWNKDRILFIRKEKISKLVNIHGTL